MYIQTELCELGNFSHFLWEYGRAFARLDEARVWKIVADISSVSVTVLDGDVLWRRKSFFFDGYGVSRIFLRSGGVLRQGRDMRY